MDKFIDESLTVEEAFWTMFHFLQNEYDLTSGEMMVGEVLSLCEPLEDGSPADMGTISDWNDAVAKFRSLNKPPHKILKK